VAVPNYEPRETSPSPQSAGAIKGQRTISLNGASMQATLYERDRLDVGATLAGPAIVEQFDATTLIPQEWSGRVDSQGNLILTRA
jgi:N-methylhydantoinase A